MSRFGGQYETGWCFTMHFSSNCHDKMYATGFVNPKTTSLLFDRVWIPEEVLKTTVADFDSILNLFERDAVGFRTNFKTTKEPDSTRLSTITLYANAAMVNIGSISPDSPTKFREEELNIKREQYKNTHTATYLSSRHRNAVIKEYAERIKNLYGYSVVPVYHDATEFDKEFSDANVVSNLVSNVVSVCLEGFPMVSEDNLQWEQVLEFKKDKASREAVKRFHRWIRMELEGKSRSEINDILCSDLEKYSMSLKKHGILTITGALSAITAAIPSVFEAITGTAEPWPVCVALASGLTLYTIDKAVELHELRKEPIALIYNILKMESQN